MLNIQLRRLRKILIRPRSPKLQKQFSIYQEPMSEKDFEEQVGITVFTNKNNGIKGILKQRFSDFIVREVTTSGDVVKLNR